MIFRMVSGLGRCHFKVFDEFYLHASKSGITTGLPICQCQVPWVCCPKIKSLKVLPNKAKHKHLLQQTQEILTMTKKAQSTKNALVLETQRNHLKPKKQTNPPHPAPSKKNTATPTGSKPSKILAPVDSLAHRRSRHHECQLMPAMASPSQKTNK